MAKSEKLNRLEIKGKSLENIKNIIGQVPQIAAILEAALEYSDVDSTKPYGIELNLTLVESNQITKKEE